MKLMVLYINVTKDSKWHICTIIIQSAPKVDKGFIFVCSLVRRSSNCICWTGLLFNISKKILFLIFATCARYIIFFKTVFLLILSVIAQRRIDIPEQSKKSKVWLTLRFFWLYSSVSVLLENRFLQWEQRYLWIFRESFFLK